MGDEGKEQEGRNISRFRGKASDGADRTLRVQRSQLGQVGVGAQLRADREDGWTPECRRAFMEALAATCNVSEAARIVGKNVSGAYYHKRRDPGFAREWAQALSIGYSELEALLLRQSLFGTEEEEVVLDGEGMVKSRKVKRGHPHTVAFRLLAAHKREAMGVQEPGERPDGDGAVERLRLALDVVRRRSGS